MNPIHLAATKGSSEMMLLLLKNPMIDIQVTNEAGVNAFWIACRCGHGNLMQILAERGIDIMITNDKGINVLHLAVIKNYDYIVKMLLESDFPMERETAEGMTALQLAAYHGREQIIDLFIEHLKLQDDPDLKNLILNKVNPKKNYSTLAYAILRKEWNIAKKLIEFEARCYYDETNDSKDFSPIFMAVQYDDDENIT